MAKGRRKAILAVGLEKLHDAGSLWRSALSPLWLTVPVIPAVLDTLVRFHLARASRRSVAGVAPASTTPIRWLVVVPARSEGRAVEPTLRSVQVAAQGHTVTIVVVVDGEDAETVACCKELGVKTLHKAPGGPSKGAALAWLVQSAGERLHDVDAVLLVDVGSRAAPKLFDALVLAPGVDGLQTRLTGTGGGTGLAVAHSERVGQEWEDRGRQALGWTVRLRGTGSILSVRALRWVAPRLRTRIEDLEASLLLAAAGYRIELVDAEIIDDKPSLVADAARQRARWLVGRLHLAIRHPLTLARLFLRRPGEALAFAVELVSRPLSLTALVRLVVAGALGVSAVAGGQLPALNAAVACVLLASVVGDLAILHLAGSMSWRSAAKLVSAWVGAVLLAPRALWRWTRVKR